MSIYSFSVEYAREYGIDEAILIHNLQFWINKNAANKKHNHDGRYWTYNSIQAFVKLFPFWSEKQVRRVLKSLIESGVILKGNYNQNPYDRTTWYAFENEGKFLTTFPPDQTDTPICPNGQMEIPKRENGSSQMGKSYKESDSKPDSKPYIIEEPENNFHEMLNPQSQSDAQECKWSEDKLSIIVSGKFKDSLLAEVGDENSLSSMLVEITPFIGEHMTGTSLKRFVSAKIHEKSRYQKSFEKRYPAKKTEVETDNPFRVTSRPAGSYDPPGTINKTPKEAPKVFGKEHFMFEYGMNESQYETFKEIYNSCIDSGVSKNEAHNHALSKIQIEDRQAPEGVSGVHHSEYEPKPSEIEDMGHSGTIGAGSLVKKMNVRKKSVNLSDLWEQENLDHKPVVNESSDKSYLIETDFMRE